MFDKNLVLIAGKENTGVTEILFLRANTLTKENHGITWLTLVEHEEFIKTKTLIKEPLDYDPIAQEVIVITFRLNGQSVFTKLRPNFFNLDKQNKSWAFYDDYVAVLKKRAENVQDKEVVKKSEPVVEVESVEEKPKKKKRKKKKGVKE